MNNDQKLVQQVGANGAKIDLAHERMNRIETELRNDLKDVYAELTKINERLNKNAGFASGVLLLSGFIGAAIAKAIEMFSNKGS